MPSPATITIDLPYPGPAPRPSSLPLLMACAPSHWGQYPGRDGRQGRQIVRVSLNTDEGSRLGTVVHGLLDRYVDGQPYHTLMSAAAAVNRESAQQIDADQCQWLVLQGIRWIDRSRRLYPGGPRKGHTMVHDLFTGTDDVWAQDERIVMVGDFKTGHVRHNYYHQMMGYLSLRRRLYPGREQYIAQVYHLRHDDADTYVKTEQAIREWEREYEQQLLSRDYRLGDHCAHCERLMDCPAAGQVARIASTTPVEDYIEMQPGTGVLAGVKRCLDVAEILEQFVKAIKAMRNAVVEQAGGQITFPDGTGLIRAIQWRKQIDPVHAIPVLTEILGPEALGGCCSITQASIKKAISVHHQYAGRSQAEVFRAILERLAEAGAVTEVPHTRINQTESAPSQIESD